MAQSSKQEKLKFVGTLASYLISAPIRLLGDIDGEVKKIRVAEQAAKSPTKLYYPETIASTLKVRELVFRALTWIVLIWVTVQTKGKPDWLSAVVILGLMTVSTIKLAAIDAVQQRHVRGRHHEERLVLILKQEFADQDVEVRHRVQIGESQDLDIFVRFPASKTMFAISVKAWGEGKVVFNEKRNLLGFRQQNGGLAYKDAPDPLVELRDHEWWLRKNNRTIFGGSSRDTKRPVKKVLVFTAPTVIQNHNEHLYVRMGDHKFLRVEREKSSIFVISEDQLIDFIKLNLPGQEENQSLSSTSAK